MFERPDWKDPEPYKELLDPDACVYVAWEFLRRNSAYQSDFLEYELEVERWRYDPKTNHNLPFCSERMRVWMKRFETDWRICFPVHFETGREGAILFTPADRFRPELFKLHTGIGPIDGPRVLIPVDLSMPLEDLEERVMRHVRELRAQGVEQGTVVPRTNRVLAPRVYVEQLRILDAFKAGATVQEIGVALAPAAVNDPEARQRDKRIKAAHAAAMKMQESGWRILLEDT